jgi:FkbM family methyltransferase
MLKGMHLSLNLKAEKSFWLGTYEPNVIRAVQDFVKPGMIVYDLGANIGYLSVAFARAVGRAGKVFAFEPMPDNVERIREHIAKNSLADTVIVVPKAVSDTNDRAMFLIHAFNAMGKLCDTKGRDEEYISQVEVSTTSLDAFVFKEGNPFPQFIKIDIEGGGEKAMPGMVGVLKKALPIILMEMHGPAESHTAWEILKLNGYRICRLEKGYPEIVDEKLLDWKEYILAKPMSRK